MVGHTIFQTRWGTFFPHRSWPPWRRPRDLVLGRVGKTPENPGHSVDVGPGDSQSASAVRLFVEEPVSHHSWWGNGGKSLRALCVESFYFWPGSFWLLPGCDCHDIYSHWDGPRCGIHAEGSGLRNFDLREDVVNWVWVTNVNMDESSIHPPQQRACHRLWFIIDYHRVFTSMTNCPLITTRHGNLRVPPQCHPPKK